MSIVDCDCRMDGSPQVNLPVKQPLHRLAAVRRLQGISQRTLARRMNVEVAEVKRQEEETSDLPLSTLYLWQKALDVPLVELLVESDDRVSQPLMQRAQLVRLMKTAMAIMEQADQEPICLMTQTLIDQLTEMMPELQGVSPWHTVGKHRRLDELGIAAQRSLSDEVFMDLTD